MAKEFNVLTEQANVIKNEVEDGANTASRVGGMFVDLVEKMNDEHIDVVQELGNRNDAVVSQAKVTTEINKLNSASGYVTCTAAAGTSAKTVTQANFTLSTNCRLIVKMANYNTAASPTLNVNNTGAKPLYYNGEVASADNTWEAGEVLDVYYDGTNYRANNMQGSAGGNMILSWNTDVATTRKSVKQNKRKAGLIIAYNHPDNGWINEQYIGTSFTDSNWANDINWRRIADNDDITGIEEGHLESMRTIVNEIGQAKQEMTESISDVEETLSGGIQQVDAKYNTLSEAKQDKLVAGENIHIDPETNTISTDKVEVVQETGTSQSATMSQKAISDNLASLDGKINAQKSEVDAAKEAAIEAINEEKQGAIADFSEQKVTPEMLSETTLQLINSSGGGIINNAADDEDLYSTGGEAPVLKFKDKEYDVASFSGMGRVYLRKNIVESKNVLTQEMVSKANTIYIVQYDYNLNAATITMPDNCILLFDGGSIDNGTITGTNTIFIARIKRIFGNNINFSGTFLIDYIYPEWFGAQSYIHKNLTYNSYNYWWESIINDFVKKLPDCAPAFNKALDLAAKYTSGIVKASGGMYNVSSTINIPCETALVTEETTVFMVFMQGDGLTVVTHKDDYSFSKETLGENAYTLAMDQFIDTPSMAVAFHIGSRNVLFEGRGMIALNKSRYTIGLLITGEPYGGMDMTYQSPKIDMRFCGGVWGGKAIDTGTQILDSVPVDTDENTSGKTIYAWDKTTKILYSKDNGQTSWGNEGVYDNLFNTSLRIDIGNPSVSDYRLINPDITINDGWGFRGIEVYIHDGAWFNISTIRGSISYKHGHYVSIYSYMEMASHDWSELEHQLNWSQAEGRLFYAKRCVDVRLGRSHDLPFSNMKDHAYYLGKGTKGVWIKDMHGLIDCVEDHGSNNVYFQNDTTFNRYGVNFKDDNAILGKTFYNALEGRTPESANLLGSANNKWCNRYIDAIPSENDYENLFNNLNSKDIDMSYCFDGDVSTKECVIDVDNEVYGVVMTLLRNNSNSVVGASFSHGWIEIDYRISGINTFTDDAIIILKQYYKDVTIIKKDLVYSQNFVQKMFLPYSNNIDIAFVALKNTKGLKLDIYGIKYFANTTASDYFNDGDRSKFMNSIKNGSICMLPASPQLMFNYGDAKNNDFYTIDGNKDTFEIIIKTTGNQTVNLYLSSKYYNSGYFEHLNVIEGINIQKNVVKKYSNNKEDNFFCSSSNFTIISSLQNEYYHRIKMRGINAFRTSNIYGDIAPILKNCNIINLSGGQIYTREDISEYVRNISRLEMTSLKVINSTKMELDIASLKNCKYLIIGTPIKLRGNIADLLTYDKNDFHMNIWNDSNIDLSEVIYNTVPYTTVLPESLNSFQIYATLLGLTNDMVDALLIDMANCIKTATGNKKIYLPSSVKRTTASDAAVAVLEELGFTITITTL
mgnify:CR=1 FL=1